MSDLRIPRRLFTIPPSAPFLVTLAHHLHQGTFGTSGPMGLSDTIVLMPNRRAARALQQVLRDTAPGNATLLPEIRAIGDADEDALLLGSIPGETRSEAETPLATGIHIEDIADAISPLERRLVLARLVMAFGQGVARELFLPDATDHLLVPVGPAEALALADDLAGLFDSFAIEEIEPEMIGTLVPEAYAGYWSISLKFLDIVVGEWPKYLAARERLDPAARRSLVLRHEAEQLERDRPERPLLIAGSTGSIPATAQLMDIVSRLPNGAVILPGLDLDLDEESWRAIDDDERSDPGHPQFGLKQLLSRLEAERCDVSLLVDENVARRPARERLMSEVMRPALTTDLWSGEALPARIIDQGLDGVSLLVSDTDALEARAIAILMRKALETPGRRTALITPDRSLSRRVSAELRRWNIHIDDTAGQPLSALPAGVFLRLVAEAAATRFTPGALTALFAHPHFRPDTMDTPRRAIAALELIALRGPRPRSGLDGLAAAFEHTCSQRKTWRHPALTRLSDDDLDAARTLLDHLQRAFTPFEAAFRRNRAAELPVFLSATRSAAEALSGSSEKDPILYAGRDGDGLANLIDALATVNDIGPETSLTNWPQVLQQLMQDVTIRFPDPDGRLMIWGPLEARLQAPECIILGGLNEGIWPNDPSLDPWLSRPMRAALGLQLPERQIGLSAHDVAQSISADEVVFSRSARSGGAPTVPSRWLQRLTTLIGKERSAALEAQHAETLAWARVLSQCDSNGREMTSQTAIARGAEPPRPCPPISARPRRFSVTEVETLIRDPFSLYARRVLELSPLEPLDAPADAALRGILIHDSLADLVRHRADGAISLQDVLEAAAPHLDALDDMPEVRALWRPRLVRIARFFSAWETDWREHRRAGVVELSGGIDLDIPDGDPVRLTARADRIDILRGRGLALIDYKTGQTPTVKEVRSGLQPQLTLEAAIARASGFDAPEIDATTHIAALIYLRLTGGIPAGHIVNIEPSDGSLDDLADAHLEGFKSLIQAYDRPEQPYLAKPHVTFRDRVGDYDHLSRFADWRDGKHAS